MSHFLGKFRVSSIQEDDVSRQLQITAWAIPAFAVPTTGRADISGTCTRTLDTRFSLGAGAGGSSGGPDTGGPVYSSLNQ
jgi:hypothetical protein